MGGGIEDKDAKAARVVVAGGLAGGELVMHFEDEVCLRGGWDEGEASEFREVGVEVVVGAEAVGVFLVAGVAEEEFVGGGEGRGGAGRSRVRGPVRAMFRPL